MKTRSPGKLLAAALILTLPGGLAPVGAALSLLGLAAVAGAVIGGKSEGPGTPSPTAP